MKKDKSPVWLIPLLIGALALGLRIWNTVSIGTDFYANFLSDASTYRMWATKLAAGGTYGEPVFQMGPLYPYFLALNMSLGLSLNAILFVQAILGAAVAIMIWRIADSIYGRTAGIAAGILAGVYAPFIFYDGLLLSESVQAFLVTLALLLIFIEGMRLTRMKFLLSGILLGLTALGRATILFFPIGLGLFWLWKQRYQHSKARVNHIPKIALLFAGLIIGILPATIHNISHGDFVLISSNTGINFYVGNNALSDGAYNEPPGLDLSSDFTGRKVAERESGLPLKSSEVSAFWTSKTLSDIQSRPGGFLWGLIKKFWLYLWYFDISQAESIQIQHLFSFPFKLPLVGFGLIFVMGVIGALFRHGDDRRAILAILLASNVIGAVLFFVIGRFRLLGAVPLLIFSGAGATVVFQALKRQNLSLIAKYAAIGAIAVIILFLPRHISTREKLASAYDNVGIFNYFRNRPEESIKWYREAAETMPDYSASLNNIGTYFYTRGQLDSSEYYFKKSLAIDSLEDKTLMNLGRIALQKGDKDEAKYYYEKARAAAPFGTAAQTALSELDADSGVVAPGSSSKSFDVLFRAAESLAARGQFDQAEKLYRDALQLKPDDIRALNNLGFACQAQKKYEDAAGIFNKVLRLYPENAIAYNNLAGTIYQIGLLDSAIVLWEKAIILDPANQQFKTNLDFVKARKSGSERTK